MQPDSIDHQDTPGEMDLYPWRESSVAKENRHLFAGKTQPPFEERCLNGFVSFEAQVNSLSTLLLSSTSWPLEKDLARSLRLGIGKGETGRMEG